MSRTCSMPRKVTNVGDLIRCSPFGVMIQPTRSEQIRCGRVRRTIKGRWKTMEKRKHSINLALGEVMSRADWKHEIITWKMGTWLVHQTFKLLPTLLSRELYTPKINFMPRFFWASISCIPPFLKESARISAAGPLDLIQVLAPIPTESDGRGVSWWPSGVGCVSLSRVSLGMYFCMLEFPSLKQKVLTEIGGLKLVSSFSSWLQSPY